MNGTTVIKGLLLLLSCLLSGALGGYYASSLSPVPAQIAIVDIQDMVMRSVGKNESQSEAQAKELTARVKATTDKLIQQGILVLDAQAVLNAPREAYVNIE
jgi:hypothetical protein